MNHSFNTPLYEMLRMVKKQLEKRETREGFKQGMKFEVYIKRMDGFKLLIPFLFRIMVMRANFTSIQELKLPLEIFHKSSETSSNSKPKGFSYPCHKVEHDLFRLFSWPFIAFINCKYCRLLNYAI